MMEYISSFFTSKVETNNNQETFFSKHHVYVNVYDMIQPNYITQIGYYALGVGIFHSGVEIDGKEYCFGGHDIPNVTGVFVVEPKIGILELTLKQTFDMGITNYTDKEIEEILLQLSDEFTGPSYHLLSRNCNHFTEQFATKLTKKTVPTWINRAAKLGNMFPCVVPWEWIQPPTEEEEADEESIDQSRRSSTLSLLSSSHRSNSQYNSYNSISQEIDNQERLLIYHSPQQQQQTKRQQ